jgi:hypothetical protein
VFDIDTKKFIVNDKRLSKNEIDVVKNNIDTSDFSNVPITKEFVDNVKQHLLRVEFITS